MNNLWTDVFYFCLVCCMISSVQPMLKLPQDACNTDKLHLGQKGCKTILGSLKFGKEGCPLDQMDKVTTIFGNIEFQEGEYKDPMKCFPSLTSIMVPEEPEYNETCAIVITNNVIKMENFTINSDLVLYNSNKKLICIYTMDYRMDAGTYRFLAMLYGSMAIRIYLREFEGVCYLKEPVIFMTALKECEMIDGDLVLNEKLELNKAQKINIKRIGNLIIANTTTLKMQDIMFLRNVEINGIVTIKNNSRLILTNGFVRNIVKNCPKCDRKKTEEELLDANSKEKRVSACSIGDIQEESEKNCKTIYGTVYLKETIRPYLTNVTSIFGRLVIRGFNSTSPFDHLPSLKYIESYSKDPPLQITQNTLLNKVEIPENLTIISPAHIIIEIAGNNMYKMSQDEYNRLADKYSKARLRIDVLNDKECYFTSPISNFYELENCDMIYGHLILKGRINGTFENKLSRISGCIEILDTDLNDTQFLEALDETSSWQCKKGHVVMNNKNLCAGKLIKRLLITRNGTGENNLVIFGNKRDCPTVCLRDDIWSGEECSVVSESLLGPINNDNNFWSSTVFVEKVKGSVEIVGTELTKIDFMNNLESIEGNCESTPFKIKLNPKLKCMDFRIPNITTPKNCRNLPPFVIDMRHNGNCFMPFEKYKKLVEKYGEDRLAIDHEEDNTYTYGLWVGIALAALVGILLTIICLIVLVVIVARRKFQKRVKLPETEEQHKPLLNQNKDDPVKNNRETPVNVKISEQNLKKSICSGSTEEVETTQKTSLVSNKTEKNSKEKEKSLKNNGENIQTLALTAKTDAQLDVNSLKKNVSVLNKETKENKTRMEDHNNEKPITAKTQMLLNWDGDLKPNDSTKSKTKTAMTAKFGEGPIVQEKNEKNDSLKESSGKNDERNSLLETQESMRDDASPKNDGNI